MLGIISIGLGMRKNGIFLVARPLRGGRGVRAWPPRKKTVFEALKKSGKNVVATKLSGG